MRNQRLFSIISVLAFVVACGRSSSKSVDEPDHHESKPINIVSVPEATELDEDAERSPKIVEEDANSIQVSAQVEKAEFVVVEDSEEVVLRSVLEHVDVENDFMLVLSKNALEHSFTRKIEEPYNKRQWQNGANIHTRGNTVGASELDLVASEKTLAIDTIFRADSSGTLNGSANHQRAYTSWCANTSVNTASRTGFRIQNDGKPTFQASRTNYIPKVTITCVRVNPRGLFFQDRIRSEASSRVYGSRRQMEQSLGRAAAGEMNQRLDKEAASAIANGDFQQLIEIRDFLKSSEATRERLGLRTTENAIQFSLNGGRTQATAPALAEGDIILRFHDKTINSLLATDTAGKKLTANELKAKLGVLFEMFSKGDSVDNSIEDATIEMQSVDPIKLSAEDDQLTIMIRAKSLNVEGEQYDYELDIKVTYEIVEENGTLALRKAGEISIYPPGFRPGVDLLKRKQKVVIDELKIEFQKFFKEELLSSAPIQHESGKNLVLSDLYANDGWFMVTHFLK